MRHFLVRPQPVPALPRCMMRRTSPTALVAPPGRAQRLAPAHVRTPPCAVPLAAIAAAAQTHLHPAPPTTIEPMTRLLLPLHASSPGTGQRPGKAGIKAPQHRLSQALRTEGPGVDGKSVPGPRFFSICLEAYQRLGIYQRHRRVSAAAAALVLRSATPSQAAGLDHPVSIKCYRKPPFAKPSRCASTATPLPSGHALTSGWTALGEYGSRWSTLGEQGWTDFGKRFRAMAILINW
jgi:hypothetical protein